MQQEAEKLTLLPTTTLPGSDAKVRSRSKAPTPARDIYGEGESKSLYYFDIIAGLTGGMSGVMVGHPFDTMKVRQQTHPEDCRTLYQCVSKTINTEGTRGFFKGMLFPLLSVGGLNSLFFTVYSKTVDHIKMYTPADRARQRHGTPTYTQIAIAAGFAGAIQAIPASPIEMVKVKLQANVGAAVYKGPLDCLVQIHRMHGLRGVFQGLVPTIAREIPGLSCYMCMYEILCDKMKSPGQVQATVHQQLMSGGAAGTMSWIINIPVDIIKSKLQADDLSRPKYQGIWHCVKHTYYHEGLRAFWRGLPVTCVRAFPVNAVTLTAYSQTKLWLQTMVLVD